MTTYYSHSKNFKAMKYYQFLAAAALFAFTACNSNDFQQGEELGEELPLKLIASQDASYDITGQMTTRAADGLYNLSSGFDGTETVYVWFNGFGSAYNVGAADANQKSTLYGGSLFFPATTTGTTSLYAVYPSASASANSHTVAADQTTADGYKASDLMFANKSVALNVDRTAAQELRFQHQLIKLKVTVTKAANINDITSLKMTNAKRTVAFTTSPTALTQGDLSDEGEIQIFSGHQTTTDAKTYTCIFPAQTWGGTGFLELTADDHTVIFTLNKSDWVNGQEYSLNLNIDYSFLNTTVDISNWVEGGGVAVGVSPGIPAADIVDLGLSVKWASMNVGAEHITDYGDYFAWGELSGFGTADGRSFDLASYVFNTDNPAVLPDANDAVIYNWGAAWRMPSKAEWEELTNTDNCAWTWQANYQGSGVSGWLVTSKKTGFTSNSIFLPAAGVYSGSTAPTTGSAGNYWSKTKASASNDNAAILAFDNSSASVVETMERYKGVCIRPVQPRINLSVNNAQIITFFVNGVAFNMVGVKHGAVFSNYGYIGWGSVSNVTLTITKDYYIGQTEVTQALWQAVMGSNPSKWPTNINNPVEQMYWGDICGEDGFLDKLNAALADQLPYGLRFKLPTEGQWEYAARGGIWSRGYTYAGSNNMDEVGWYNENSAIDGKQQPHPVGLKKPNELGLYDMSGNVFEWLRDYYAPLTANSTLVDPTGATSPWSPVYYCIRGGHYKTGASSARISNRGVHEPTLTYDETGFRLVLE